MGKPVRLMWHRTDDARVGRTHPMATSRIRASYQAGNVLTFEQRHTSVSTDLTHGLGEIITAMAAKLPVGGNLSFAETIFTLSQEVPYNYGVTDQTLSEVDAAFNTGSMRNIYSPDVCTARELIIDQLAAAMGKDPLAFRREFLKTARARAVLDKVAEVGRWGRPMPSGTAQGIALHKEYKGVNACLVELDCRPQTVGRTIRDAWTGPRVTKVVMAVDVGLAINPRGPEAQMQGGIMNGIALALTSSLHLKDGYFLEGSWDDYFYTRQWNAPPEIQVVVMPSDVGEPGGAGEFGVASAYAATACAYAFNPCSVPVSKIRSTDEVTTIEGLPETVGRDLHPMQEAWIDEDVAQCGYCRPGQIMAAVAKVNQARREGRVISDADFDEIRNICRCGTYFRIREATRAGAKNM